MICIQEVHVISVYGRLDVLQSLTMITVTVIWLKRCKLDLADHRFSIIRVRGWLQSCYGRSTRCVSISWLKWCKLGFTDHIITITLNLNGASQYLESFRIMETYVLVGIWDPWKLNMSTSVEDVAVTIVASIARGVVIKVALSIPVHSKWIGDDGSVAAKQRRLGSSRYTHVEGLPVRFWKVDNRQRKSVFNNHLATFLAHVDKVVHEYYLLWTEHENHIQNREHSLCCVNTLEFPSLVSLVYSARILLDDSII